jgi:REP element-mobilizing transposase RayT/DNA-binding response OmpR family regulator
MAIPLLVLTQDVTFGELVSRSLEGESWFSVRVLRQVDEATAYVRKEKCSLTFLDLDIADALEAGRALRQANAEMRFVFLSAVEADPALDELNPRAHLTKTFNVKDLLELMDKLFQPLQAGTPRRAPQNAPAAPPVVNLEMPWLADVNRAAQHLTRLTLESSAQAALINRENELWAYAGQLPQAAAHELGRMVARYWDKTEESDLVRFVRLNSTKAEHMLFATRLAAGLVLALAFDAETPFSTIRTQAGQLVHALSASQPVGEEASNEAGGAVDTLPLAPVEAYKPESSKESLLDYAEPVPPATTSEVVAEPATKTRTGRQNAVPKTEEKTPDAQDDTQPRLPTEEGRNIVLEPVSASVYNLTYACLLIPRFTQHHLTGDLAERLSEWMPEICIAFGWRLEFISVRPDYLHWLANVPPAASPGYMMRVIRQRISEKIFEEFPRFKKENPSGDFWAPGYLIMGNTQPAPAQVIKDFIQQTRQRQGISNSLKPFSSEFPG